MEDKRIRIIVDAMGGDLAPREIVKGSIEAAREWPLDIILVGKEDAINKILKEENADTANLRVVAADEVVDMEDDPARVLRDKKGTSMGIALDLLRNGEGDALVSAGSTGALLTGATLFAKRIRGIRRAALAPVVPNGAGGSLLIDCGANAECTPEYLLQFGYMGSFYAKKQMGILEPRVALINIGTEESKGNTLYQEAYQLLKKADAEGRIRFIGNIEGRDVVSGAADVMVCDGFTGNVVLKTIEGVGMFFAKEIKGIFTESLKTKIAALMVKSGIRRFKKIMDYKETGGAPLLGISKAVIKAHGSSDARSFKNAIKQAYDYAMSGFIEEVEENIDYMRV